jgi:hypothetical protein
MEVKPGYKQTEVGVIPEEWECPRIRDAAAKSSNATVGGPFGSDLVPEQRAIATALSDVDGLLGGLDRLIAKKRDLKQAAMQQLLTGQTRLPGFHGEWEVKRLGQELRCLGNAEHCEGDRGLAAASNIPNIRDAPTAHGSRTNRHRDGAE